MPTIDQVYRCDPFHRGRGALQQALLASEEVLAYQFEGKRYDCGSKLGYLQATVEYALNHSSLGKEFEKYLLELAQSRLDRS